MNQEIVIEKMTQKDVAEVVRMGLATKELHVESDKAEYYTEEQLRSFVTSPDDIYLAARVDGELAGYRLATYNPFLKEAYLIDIVVKEKFRSMGIGERLYKETGRLLKERGCIWVWALVAENNRNMMGFIEKQGFLRGRKFYFYYRVEE